MMMFRKIENAGAGPLVPEPPLRPVQEDVREPAAAPAPADRVEAAHRAAEAAGRTWDGDDLFDNVPV